MSNVDVWRRIEEQQSNLSGCQRRSNEWLRTTMVCRIGGEVIPIETELVIWRASSYRPRTLATFFVGEYLVSVLSNGDIVRRNTPRLAGLGRLRRTGRERLTWNARTPSGSG